MKNDTVTLNKKHPHITNRKGICGGEPVIDGTRTPVRSIVGYYKLGMSVDEILEGLPYLKAAEVYDALAYYFDNPEEIEEYIEDNDEEKLMKKYPSGKLNGGICDVGTKYFKN